MKMKERIQIHPKSNLKVNVEIENPMHSNGLKSRGFELDKHNVFKMFVYRSFKRVYII
jgi:hypothetical protein